MYNSNIAKPASPSLAVYYAFEYLTSGKQWLVCKCLLLGNTEDPFGPLHI